MHEDPKKTSIHLVREKAFAGIATRKESLVLTLKASKALKSRRVAKKCLKDGSDSIKVTT